MRGHFLPYGEKHALWEKRNPFTAKGNRFSLLQRPRSQDISGISTTPQQCKSIHESVEENERRNISPKRKMKFGRTKGNLVFEETERTRSKFHGSNGEMKERSGKGVKHLIRSKVCR